MYRDSKLYVDDLLSGFANGKGPLEELKRSFKFKDDAIEPQQMYLGAHLQVKQLNGRSCWIMSSIDYIREALKNVEE